MTRKIAFRSLKNLCAFIGAIVLFSYFYNWAVDLRHWYMTVASAFVCLILWLSFYMLEVHKRRVTRLLLAVKRVVLEWLSGLRTKPELASPTSELPADPPVEPAPNPVPWRPPQRAR